MNFRVTWEALRLGSAAFLSLSSAQQNLHWDLSSPFWLFGLNIRGHAEVTDISFSTWRDSPNVFLDYSLLFMIPCWILHTDRAGGVSSIPEFQQNGLFCCIENGNDKAKISRAAPVKPVPPVRCGLTLFYSGPILRISNPKWGPVWSTQIFRTVSAPSWLLSTLFRWPRRFYLNLYYLNLFKFFRSLKIYIPLLMFPCTTRWSLVGPRHIGRIQSFQASLPRQNND